MGADTSAFAWEWLRRTEPYRAAWRSSNSGSLSARTFGLERFEDPSLPAPFARPVWSEAVSANVLRAHVSDPFAPARDRIDLRLLAPLVTLVIGDDEVEHLLLSDGRYSVRIDIVVGTLIGCPAALTYLLHGLFGLKGPIGALQRLATLVGTGCFSPPPAISSHRQRRWITELRVADALAAGQDQQSIARALFGHAVSECRWRAESAPYRRRVQRLVKEARLLLADPVTRWFRVSA